MAGGSCQDLSGERAGFPLARFPWLPSLDPPGYALACHPGLTLDHWLGWADNRQYEHAP